MVNQKFGRLLVLASSDRKHPNRPRYLCVCDCGAEITADHYHLLSGHTSSCGCAKLDRLVSMNKTHGMSKSPTYKSWLEARYRCLRPNCKHYQNYGGRGISICDRWRKFENFLADMGERPSPLHSLDRIDVNGNYEPGNCRWATAEQQQNNKRVNRYVEYLGRQVTITQLARLTGVPQSTLHRWIIKEGKSVKEALPTS
jgi:hypothetical protein